MTAPAPVRVFIAGSRSLSRLNAAIRERLNRIIEAQHHILIGDANGADRAVQQFLSDGKYPNVTVFCTGLKCRNNIGLWQMHMVAPPAGVHGGFDFYATKDREMSTSATHGLMLWDGESRGTLANVRNLVNDGKPVVVYLASAKVFFNVRTPADIEALVTQPVPAP